MNIHFSALRRAQKLSKSHSDLSTGRGKKQNHLSRLKGVGGIRSSEHIDDGHHGGSTRSIPQSLLLNQEGRAAWGVRRSASVKHQYTKPEKSTNEQEDTFWISYSLIYDINMYSDVTRRN